MSSTDLWEFAMRCTGCRLTWILFSERPIPDRHCKFCGHPLVKASARG